MLTPGAQQSHITCNTILTVLCAKLSKKGHQKITIQSLPCQHGNIGGILHLLEGTILLLVPVYCMTCMLAKQHVQIEVGKNMQREN